MRVHGRQISLSSGLDSECLPLAHPGASPGLVSAPQQACWIRCFTLHQLRVQPGAICSNLCVCFSYLLSHVLTVQYTVVLSIFQVFFVYDSCYTWDASYSTLRKCWRSLTSKVDMLEASIKAKYHGYRGEFII
ncbi:hypothetical protein TIFTF001_048437 [Ficus carica]|uniref:Uncharacterized protein n=1 Tax=Ficus carica TaxID=3494 RepID=A0AA88CYA6_FICCA|nr:hypothetical protein TIFTF001_048437 [Ficus carica]